MGTPAMGKRSRVHRAHPAYHAAEDCLGETVRTVTGVMDSGHVATGARAHAGREVVGDRGMETADRFRKLALAVDAPDTGRAAREIVTLTLGDWGLAGLVDDV